MYTDMYILQIVYENGSKCKNLITRGKLYECLDIITDISKNNTVRSIEIKVIIDNRKK